MVSRRQFLGRRSCLISDSPRVCVPVSAQGARVYRESLLSGLEGNPVNICKEKGLHFLETMSETKQTCFPLAQKTL